MVYGNVNGIFSFINATVYNTTVELPSPLRVCAGASACALNANANITSRMFSMRYMVLLLCLILFSFQLFSSLLRRIYLPTDSHFQVQYDG